MLAEMDMTRATNNPGTIFLDPDQKSPRAQDFEERLTARIVGQERAVRRMSGLYQIFLAGMNPPNRPIGTMLFLGPTGSEKTRVIEAAAEVLRQGRDDHGGQPDRPRQVACRHLDDRQRQERHQLVGAAPGDWHHAKERVVPAAPHSAGDADRHFSQAERHS